MPEIVESAGRERQRLARIAFVTREYGRLRGSIQSVFFAPFAVMTLQGLRDGDRSATFWWFIGFITIAPAGVAGLHYWMNRRFGRVVATGATHAWRMWLPLLLGAAFSTLEKLDAWALAAGKPSVFLMTAGAVLLWFGVRDWPHRKHIALPISACFAAAVFLSHPGHLQWRPTVELAVVATWVAACAGDLMMIGTVLPGTARRRAGGESK